MNPNDPKIWQAIIDEAFAKATGKDAAARYAARRWLIQPSPWLTTVCTNAGLDPKEVMDRAVCQFRQKRKKIGRPSREIEHNGLTLTINEWARHLDIDANTIRYRLKRGHPIEVVLSNDYAGTHLTHEGHTRSITAWARLKGLKPGTIRNRLQAGHPIAVALMPGRISPGPGGGSRLSKYSGDRRGEVSARDTEIGVFPS